MKITSYRSQQNILRISFCLIVFTTNTINILFNIKIMSSENKYTCLKDKYPNMYECPWYDIIDAPNAPWKSWGANNFLVVKTHEMFKVLNNNNCMTTEEYNDLQKVESKYVEMDKKVVEQIIHGFEEAKSKETNSATTIQSKIRMHLQRKLYLEILSLKPGGTGYKSVEEEFNSLVLNS